MCSLSHDHIPSNPKILHRSHDDVSEIGIKNNSMNQQNNIQSRNSPSHHSDIHIDLTRQGSHSSLNDNGSAIGMDQLFDGPESNFSNQNSIQSQHSYQNQPPNFNYSNYNSPNQQNFQINQNYNSFSQPPSVNQGQNFNNFNPNVIPEQPNNGNVAPNASSYRVFEKLVMEVYEKLPPGDKF